MDYLIKASGLVILLFLFYQLFLKNETFFKSIRFYFLIGLIIVIALPLLEIPIYVEYVSQQLDISYFEVINSSEVKSSSIDWVPFLATVYSIGLIFFSLKFLVQLISLTYLIISHKPKKQGNHFFIETSKDISPFSFFNYIVFNNKQFNSTELEQIINHEKAHAIQLHSLDTLLAHILVILLWFNPFVWLYKKAVQQNLEFLADSYALKLADNENFYQLTLLKIFQKNYCTEITNNFYNSLIKKRITMLQKNRSTNKNQWKYALLVPLLAAFVFAFNTTTIAQEKKLIEIENIDKLEVKLQIDKDSKHETLKEEAAFFKKEFDADISFKGIKRNNKNEIIAIKISSKHKSNSSVFMRKSDEPILPIIISYSTEIDKINIGDAIDQEDEITIIHKKNHNKLKKTKNIWDTKKMIDTIVVKGNKISWDKDDDNHLEVEVIETDDNQENYKVKVTSAVFISDDGEKTELIMENDNNKTINASEHVYIIKSDEKGKKDKVIKSQKAIKFNSSKDQPLYILDKKEISAKEMESIDPNSIKAINVLKSEAAIEIYGEKGKNGVVVITLKE
jgi:bla regulator protein BlaR1